MNPVTHLLVAWNLAQAAELSPRERRAIVAAGIVPDLDGAGILLDFARGADPGLGAYAAYHHVIGHNLLGGVLLAGLAAAIARRRLVTAALAFLSFHLHLLGDLIGSAGPGRSLWTLSYLYPFSEREFVWQGQWELNAWPNIVFTLAMLALTGAILRGRRAGAAVGAPAAVREEPAA